MVERQPQTVEELDLPIEGLVMKMDLAFKSHQLLWIHWIWSSQNVHAWFWWHVTTICNNLLVWGYFVSECRFKIWLVLLHPTLEWPIDPHALLCQLMKPSHFGAIIAVAFFPLHLDATMQESKTTKISMELNNLWLMYSKEANSAHSQKSRLTSRLTKAKSKREIYCDLINVSLVT